MPNIVVAIIVIETRNEPAAEKSGRERAASHSNSGKSHAAGTTLSHGFWGSFTVTIVASSSSTTTPVTSMISLHGGGSRMAAATPIINGPTKTTPIKSFAVVSRQVVRNGSALV